MNYAYLGYEFEKLLQDVFIKFDFEADIEVVIQHDSSLEVDLICIKNGLSTWAEVKFYRDDRVSISNIKNAILRLFDKLQIYSDENTTGLLIVSSYLTQEFKKVISEDYGISIWDRSDIYYLIKKVLKDDLLLERFEKLLLKAKQGVDIENVFDKVIQSEKTAEDFLNLFNFPNLQNTVIDIKTAGKTLYTELVEIPTGKKGWRPYELKCIEILKYLFEDELSNWNTQKATDDELSRFDMICRIIGQSSFWSSLVQSFQTRYILFEFKNYNDPIGQDQIYTTERYLYLRGLRSVAFIISREGGQPQALKASKGALKEHGKLIIILNNKDLDRMLQMKDSGDNPSDYLSDILDDFLISLSR
ncbi:hypothetical protein [Chryseobacterium lineare]